MQTSGHKDLGAIVPEEWCESPRLSAEEENKHSVEYPLAIPGYSTDLRFITSRQKKISSVWTLLELVSYP